MIDEKTKTKTQQQLISKISFSSAFRISVLTLQLIMIRDIKGSIIYIDFETFIQVKENMLKYRKF